MDVNDNPYAPIITAAPKHRRHPNTLASLDTVSSNAGAGPISQSEGNLAVSTNITTALASNNNQHKSVEMRRQEAEQAILKTANIKKVK